MYEVTGVSGSPYLSKCIGIEKAEVEYSRRVKGMECAVEKRLACICC